MSKKVTKGNVFKHLGFTDEEAVAYAMRVELALEIERSIKRMKFTQAKAADYFGVKQPKISKIVSGDVGGFTINYLVKMVAKARKTPRLSFAKRRAA